MVYPAVCLAYMVHSIKNFDALAETDVRRDALLIAEAAYDAIDLAKAFERKVKVTDETLEIEGKTWSLAGRKIYFIGVGKCAFAAAIAAENLLGDRLTAGIALDVKELAAGTLKKIEALTGTHPEPSETNMAAANKIVGLLKGATEQDLVLLLISGGGSTLLCLHDAPMTCLDEKVLFDELTDKGATIQELNTVRKHISLARGGGLAKAAYPAEAISLIVSDVPGNDIEFIASGPTVRDTSSIDDARAVLARYSLPVPAEVAFIETPKEEKYFTRVTNLLFLTNNDALEAMTAAAAGSGYSPRVVSDRLCGEARDLAHRVAEDLHKAAPRTALLYAGESTVTLGGEHGKGGRSQELALAALADVHEGEVILPFASDGHDFTDHAGALADHVTLAHASAKALDPGAYLVRHASYDFFAASGDALLTGKLESNVSDLLIALKR